VDSNSWKCGGFKIDYQCENNHVKIIM